jgi:type II secretory pathway predicted ATPase ExeA
MYQNFFGICLPPFEMSPDPRFLYMMPQIREALACLQFGIANKKGFVVLTGEVGTGKTTLLRTVLNTFPKNHISSAFVFNPRLDVLDFFEFVLTDFGIPPVARTKSGMVLQLNRWLIERHREGCLCLLVIDEAQNLSPELLEEIRLLTNLETSSEKLLQVVLAGQPELDELLHQPWMRQLRQRIAIRCRTLPLTAEQTEAYIASRAQVAGAKEELFTVGAVQAIHSCSCGIPRVINLICEHALITAYADGVKPVPAHIVESVCLELELNQHASMPRALMGREVCLSPHAMNQPSRTTVHSLPWQQDGNR